MINYYQYKHDNSKKYAKNRYLKKHYSNIRLSNGYNYKYYTNSGSSVNKIYKKHQSHKTRQHHRHIPELGIITKIYKICPYNSNVHF